MMRVVCHFVSVAAVGFSLPRLHRKKTIVNNSLRRDRTLRGSDLRKHRNIIAFKRERSSNLRTKGWAMSAAAAGMGETVLSDN